LSGVASQPGEVRERKGFRCQRFRRARFALFKGLRADGSESLFRRNDIRNGFCRRPGGTPAALAATLDAVGLNEPGCENGAAVAVAGELLLVSSSATRFSSCSTRSSSHRSRSVNGAGASILEASLFAGADFEGGLLESLSSASKRLERCWHIAILQEATGKFFHHD